MTANIDIKKPIWIALSELYLDTEVQDDTVKYIAKVFYESPFSLEEVWEINRRDVFPVLKYNLLSVAGIWTGFKEDWLVQEISRRNQRERWLDGLSYRVLKGMLKQDMERVRKAYSAIKG